MLRGDSHGGRKGSVSPPTFLRLRFPEFVPLAILDECAITEHGHDAGNTPVHSGPVDLFLKREVIAAPFHCAAADQIPLCQISGIVDSTFVIAKVVEFRFYHCAEVLAEQFGLLQGPFKRLEEVGKAPPQQFSFSILDPCSGFRSPLARQ